MSALLATSGVYVCVFVMRDGVQQSVSYEVRLAGYFSFESLLRMHDSIQKRNPDHVSTPKGVVMCAVLPVASRGWAEAMCPGALRCDAWAGGGAAAAVGRGWVLARFKIYIRALVKPYKS